MRDTNIRRPKSRKVKKRFSYVLLAIIMLAAIAVGLGTFFLVSDVEVSGNSKYSGQQIADASGISIGDSIFLVKPENITENIKHEYPYVENVDIKRHLPGTVDITIEESFPAAWIELDKNAWIIDKNARLLEKSTKDKTGGLIEVTGLEPLQPVAGSRLAVSVEQSELLKNLRVMMSSMESLGIIDKVTKIDLTSESNVNFDFDGRFNVVIGRCDNLTDKLELLDGVLDKMDADERGIIDLSIDGRAHFLPK